VQKWIRPPACSDKRLHRIMSSYWLAHFYLIKKSAKVLLYFGLDCGMLEFSRAVIQRTNYVSPTFFARFGGKHHGLSTCKQWSKQIGLKSKTCSGGFPFQGLSNGTAIMQIQSGLTVLLKVGNNDKFGGPGRWQISELLVLWCRIGVMDEFSFHFYFGCQKKTYFRFLLEEHNQ
jgi:hypothetical protein